MFYLIWIPIVSVLYCLIAWLSFKNNTSDVKWFFILYVISCIQPWAFISRYSKNLFFDGIIYDCILFLSYNFMLIYLGTTKKFGVYQWIGLFLVAFGLLLIKTNSNNNIVK